MANETKDIKLISRNNSGFPDWLDFNKLRTEGIEHIGQLSGKIWTDHNVHDPGITTIEALCYALLDLGYRTNLPVKDIFARDPEDASVDDNFFTPAEILTVSPLTITDYRKMLIDIPGVKNAWLEIATDRKADDICNNLPSESFHGYHKDLNETEDPCCENYLNGLYHVYIETEKDLGDKTPGNRERECLLEKIKRALMSHRNLCEDFLDITFLCKWKIGICAEIDLEDNADPEKVYLEMIEKLRQFFSPSPRFYTLEQMLDNNKSMDEIFAGRPFDAGDSHGFVDTEELEKLELKKTIHVSDVYNILFSVAGIRKVTRLRLVDCKKQKQLDKWVVKIPENNVPDFQINCSGFAFKRRGMPVTFDFKRYDTLLEINFEHNGKILYTFPSDKLDAAIPRGVHHKNLSTYNSIQNEFPRVYGIAEGGLPENISPKRKAQALQFKGYLLFFDHLLANYLSQLKNIRSLFPVRPQIQNSKKRGNTYFSSLPGDVPDFQQLVRYEVDGSSGKISKETGYLAFPVNRKSFQDIINRHEYHCLNIDELPHYRFPTSAEKDIAIAQLEDDMHNEHFEIFYVTRNDECVFYYIISSSEDFVLVSRKLYSDEQAAMLAASSIKYAGTIRNSYRSANLGPVDGHSFSVELNVEGYAGFLQQLTEDDILYGQRRQGFLDHLLARFAESFTDYALLSYQSEEMQLKNTDAKQFYLSNYPLLSSSRGKAFDYTLDGWNNENNSGFEKKIRALLGHKELKRKTICNFEIYDYGIKYIFQLRLSPSLVIRSQEKFETRNEAIHSAGRLIGAMGLRSSYYVQRDRQTARIFIKYDQGSHAEIDTLFSSVEVADRTADHIHRMIAMPPANGFIQVAEYKYTASLRNEEGFILRKQKASHDSQEQALNSGQKLVNKVNDPDSWEQTETRIGKLVAHPHIKTWWIDETIFKTDINNNIIGNPELYSFEILDKGNHFLFRSIEHYSEPKKAKEKCSHAIRLFAGKENLLVQETGDEGKWSVYVTDKDNKIAQCSLIMNSREEAEEILRRIRMIIASHVFSMENVATPFSYKFYYHFGSGAERPIIMESGQNYFSESEATLALADFCNSINRTSAKKSAREWQLVSEAEGKHKLLIGQFPGVDDEQMQTVSQWLDVQKAFSVIKEAGEDPGILASYVDVNEDNPCHITWQLVDKDGLYAVSNARFIDLVAATNGLQNLISGAGALPGYLELLSNISEYIETGTKTRWFHYQLVTRDVIADPNGGPSRKLVLFESTKGYESKEEAGKAFVANHMKVLSFAMHTDNYGEGKPISDREVVDRDKTGCGLESIVFVPAGTLAFLGNYPQLAIEELSRIIRTYPLRSIRKTEEEVDFKSIFLPCEPPDPCKPEQEEVCYAEEEPVYYFVLFDKLADDVAWQSVNYYDTPSEAMDAFRFFLFLIGDQLNYTIMPDCKGGYKLYVREVLLESFGRFENERLAWGRKGIQKFIGVSQQPYSFHPYMDSDCCFRFFVACKNNRVYHPCTYDSPEIRDKVLMQLQQLLPAIQKWKFSFCREKWSDTLIDFEGNGIARMQMITAWKSANLFESYLDLFELVGNHCLVINEAEGYVGLEAPGKELIHFYPLLPGMSLQQLKEKISWLSCYFPFTRKMNKDKTVSYCIEIRLPGFNSCDTCDDGTDLCAVAWTSDCCFLTCFEVLNAYHQIITWLGIFRFYKEVFDCPCGSYGIELYDDEPKCINENAIENNQPFSLPKIIAISPLCYKTAEMVCAAIERAKMLINSEGIHIVEHILLRPRCIEDCTCIIQPCDELGTNDCKLPYWIGPEKDPCKQTNPVCFHPGQDPYSFITTVVVPAWPDKFRDADNKKLLELMLQREFPAHILPRILWLTPHDMCCFEKRYRKWMLQTAYEESRTVDSIACGLVNFLFDRQFECMSEEQPCIPCDSDDRKQVNCVNLMELGEKVQLLLFEKRSGREDSCLLKTWKDHVNELYCWPGMNCSEDFFIPCDRRMSENIIIENKNLITKQAEEDHADTPLIEKKQGKLQFLNSRRSIRMKKIDSLIGKAGEHELLVRTKRLLESPTPAFALYNKLIKDLLPEKKERATPLHDRDLIFIATHAYLDNLASTEDPEKLALLKPVIKFLHKGGLNTDKMYREWKPRKMAEYVSAEYTNKIDKLFA